MGMVAAAGTGCSVVRLGASTSKDVQIIWRGLISAVIDGIKRGLSFLGACHWKFSRWMSSMVSSGMDGMEGGSPLNIIFASVVCWICLGGAWGFNGRLKDSHTTWCGVSSRIDGSRCGRCFPFSGTTLNDRCIWVIGGKTLLSGGIMAGADGFFK